MQSIVITFGRMTPPTKGHELLIKKVQDLAIQNNCQYYIFLSQTKDKNNVLDWEYKKHILESSSPHINIFSDLTIKTPFQALELFAKQGYKKIILVVGEDRREDFNHKMTPYAKEWGVEHFEVVSAGQRNKDANDVTGISSSKLRQYAFEDNKEEFCKGLISNLSSDLQSEIFDKIRQSM